MSHEQSETIQLENGRWINVYGRDTEKAGEQLPEDDSGIGHKEYDTLDEAVKEAVRRSKHHGEHHPEHRIIPHEKEKPSATRTLIDGRKVPNPRPGGGNSGGMNGVRG